MISVLLYGRNDAYGYNLHKRASISLNCIAEMLGDADDEMLFVDYNTPDDLPTFIEAIYDTLTARTRSLLRVFRVRPQVHARIAAPTRLLALEPHSRNIALRRSNPRNRWVLSTNTDMVFVPRAEFSGLDDAVVDLADGQYIVPRFELPESVWEAFPRSDPRTVIQLCEELGTKLHLNEVTLAHPYMRFHMPGDFQLVPRQALFEINGFEERMVDGWHTDSNMCKRLNLFYGGQTESLASRFKGYHCDHTRVPSLNYALGASLQNDPQEFVYDVTDPVAHHQEHTWGAPEEAIEEIDFASGPQGRYLIAVQRALEQPQSGEYLSDANDLRNFVWYQQEHALPYLASNLTTCAPGTRIAYIGNNPRMLELAARCISEMGFSTPLQYAAQLLGREQGPDGAVPIGAGQPYDVGSLSNELLANFDLLVFDFGLDRADGVGGEITRVTDWPRHLRYSLGAVARCFEECSERSDARKSGERPIPEFIVLNAGHHVFQDLVAQFMLGTAAPWNTHVRKGRPRVGDERLYRSKTWKITEDRLAATFGYDMQAASSNVLGPGQAIDLTSSGSSSAFKDGHWGAIDESGSWTDGPWAELVFSPAPSLNDDVVAQVRITEAMVHPGGEPICVQVVFESECLSRFSLPARYGVALHGVVLPRRLLADRSTCRLRFCVENPHSPSPPAALPDQSFVGEDPRELGLKIQGLSVVSADRLRYSMGETVDFSQHGRGALHLTGTWTPPDRLGVWTLGDEASLALRLAELVDPAVVAAFELNDAAVGKDLPPPKVSVGVNGSHVADWIVGPTRDTFERRIVIPQDVLQAHNPAVISFGIDEPRTPDTLGWIPGDTRRIGFRMSKLRIEPATRRTYRWGEMLEFNFGGYGSGYLGHGWSPPDAFGTWSVGPQTSLTIPCDATTLTSSKISASFEISDCAVSDTSPVLQVLARANGKIVGKWQLGPERKTHWRSVELPVELIAAQPNLELTFEVPTPHTPASLGWSADSRPLGFRISRAVLAPPEPLLDVAELGRSLGSAMRNRLRSLRARTQDVH